MEVQFTSDPEVVKLIDQIVKRFKKDQPIVDYRPMQMEMDLNAASCSCPNLDLKVLLESNAFDFVHDVIGIRDHMDRKTGKLLHHFLPRCARKANHATDR